MFDTSFVGFLINPSFIARSGLIKVISDVTSKFKSELVIQKNILDVGCGSKPYQDLFSGARKYVGLDTLNSGHDHSQESIDQYYDGRIFPFENHSFDAVVSFQVLEHVQDEALFYNEVKRVLKPDGILLLTVPFCWQEHEQPYDFRRFTSFGIRRNLESVGFEIIELKKTTSYFQTVLQYTNSYFATAFKTRLVILNIIINIFFNLILNSLSILFSLFDKNEDLYCDIVVLAKSK